MRRNWIMGCMVIFLYVVAPCRSEVPKTVPEQTNYAATSHLRDVVSFFHQLQLDHPEQVILSGIGPSLEGRNIPLVILGNPAGPAPTGRPVILLVGNIHGGEVEGKEALQMLARDLLYPEPAPILSRFTILMVPVFNVDGNERIDPSHRPYQRVRDGVGTRTNALNMDLNRDFIKLDSPEVRSLVHLFDQWRPLVMVDCHTTNGSYHVEPLTWTWGANPNGGEAMHRYIYEQFMPWLHSYVQKQHGVLAIPYGNFDNPYQPTRWGTFSNRLVYGVSYFGVKGAFSFLNENYAYADFPTRIKACYAFLDGVLTFADHHLTDMTRLAEAYRSHVPPVLMTDIEPRAFPEPVTIRSFEMRKGEDGRAHPTDTRKDVTVPYMGDFTGIPRPVSGTYVFPAGMVALARKLADHGISVYRVTEAVDVDASIYHLDTIRYADRPFQGHIMMTDATGTWRSERRRVAAGWFAVPLDRTQPYRQLAVVLLEPESIDALYRYGMFNTLLYPSQWRRSPGDYPIWRVPEPNKVPLEMWRDD